MITWLNHKVETGKMYKGIYDFNHIYHDQPVLVIREASKEEYIEYYKSENKGKIGGPLENLNGLYFYEVQID